MSETSPHKQRDVRAARRALLSDLEALREALGTEHHPDADVPILDDVVRDPAPAPGGEPSEAARESGSPGDWRGNADRLMDEARQRIAHLRREAARGQMREPDAQQRARLVSELSVWLHERIDAELADLRIRLASEMETELNRAVEALFRGTP